MNPNLPRHALWRPGMTWDAIGALDPQIRHPMTRGRRDPQARLADMDAMGVDQALLYPTWFAEGFLLVQRSRRRVRAGARLQRLDRRFLRGGAGPAVRRRDAAAAEHGLRARGTGASRGNSVVPRRLHPADVHRETAISTIRTTTRSGPSWNGSA